MRLERRFSPSVRPVAGAGGVMGEDLGPPRGEGVVEGADLLDVIGGTAGEALSRRVAATLGSSVR